MIVDLDLRCAVCGSSSGHESRLDGMLRRCGGCTFAWTAAPSPPPEELYDETYFRGEGYEDYFQPADRRRESRLRLRWLLRAGRPDSLVEAGSAGGYFVEAARRAGIAAEGVEVSATAARFARDQLGVPVRADSFEQARFSLPFQAVCGFHVLEHVEEPHEFIRAARRALVPGGCLALEVPNLAGAAAHRLGPLWPHLEPRYHRWHFTPTSLRRLVASHGFEVVRLDTVFSRFYWRRSARLRNARDLLVADWWASGRPTLRHPTLGDAIRLIARRPESWRRNVWPSA